jgi:hypothetical protein
MGAENHTRITIETERTLIVAHQHATRAWREGCGGDVEFLRSDQAGDLLTAARERLKGQYPGSLHLRQAKDGLVICLKSLLRLLGSN